MKYRIDSHRVLPAFVLLVFVFLQGCVANLPAVRDFSQTTVVASDSFDGIAEDLPKSCLRRVELTFEGKRVALSADNQVEYTPKYINFLATCNDLKKSLYGMLEANNVLKGYAEALGQLASNDAVTFTTQLGALRASLGEIKINEDNPFQGARADAVFNLAQFLLNAAASGYRQRELKLTIETGQRYIGPIIKGLSAVAGDYQAVLEDERLKVENIQNNLKRELNKSADSRKLGEEEINQKLFETKRMVESIDAKNKAAEEYKTILEKIAETHGKLYKSTNELDSVVLILLIEDYTKELIPLIKDINQAFSS